MGYLTDFELKHSGVDEDALVQALTEISEYGWDDDLSLYAVKWYSWDKDMIKISTKFPDVLFTLTGSGEEDGDMWRCYFKNGKMQLEKAIITYAPFDESKLE